MTLSPFRLGRTVVAFIMTPLSLSFNSLFSRSAVIRDASAAASFSTENLSRFCSAYISDLPRLNLFILPPLLAVQFPVGSLILTLAAARIPFFFFLCTSGSRGGNGTVLTLKFRHVLNFLGFVQPHLGVPDHLSKHCKSDVADDILIFDEEDLSSCLIEEGVLLAHGSDQLRQVSFSFQLGCENPLQLIHGPDRRIVRKTHGNVLSRLPINLLAKAGGKQNCLRESAEQGANLIHAKSNS